MRDILVGLVKHHEDRHCPIPAASPVEIIRAHVEATARRQSDLATLIGSAPRASEVLNRKRALTVEMVRRLHVAWGIPTVCLVRLYALETSVA